MTDSYLTLTTFVPGTKAKADDVNSNFSTLRDAILTRALQEGDSTKTFSVAAATSDSHAANKSQLDDLSDFLVQKINQTGMKFCVKSGNTTNGEGDLFEYSLLQLTPKVGGNYKNLVVSNYKGLQKTFSALSNLTLSGKADGDYNIFIQPDGTLYAVNNKIYVQTARPAMLDGDVWLDTSVEPLSCIKYSAGQDLEFLDVPLARVTIKSSAVSKLITFKFNQNGYDVNVESFTDKKFDYANPINKVAGTTYSAESNGLLFTCHSNTYDTIAITIEGVCYTLGWSSSQGSGSSSFMPVGKGQSYNFSGGYVHYFIPEIDS